MLGAQREISSWSEGRTNFVQNDKTMAHLIHGPVDCDQIDYLLRDSHFTGVKHGVIDHRRLIMCLERHGGDISVEGGRSPSARRNACSQRFDVQCGIFPSGHQSYRGNAFEGSRAK